MKITTVVYIFATLLFLIWFLFDFGTQHPGGFFPSKRKFEMGFIGIGVIAIWLVYTLIWGGMFWW